MKLILGLIIALILVGLFALTGAAAKLGAHPWWAQSTVLIGMIAGLIIASLTRGRGPPSFATLTVIASLIAWYGKTQFAASFAEDAFAGRLWYFGWIAIAAFATTTIVALWVRHIAPQDPR